jgi:hypothetical protein
VFAIDIMNLRTPSEDHRRLNLKAAVVEADPGLKNLDGLGSQTATARLTQNRLKDGIFLANNLGKLMNFKVKSFPQRAFKDKLGVSSGDRGELIEVTDEDELDPTERTITATDGAANGIQLLEQLGSQHGHFVNHQNIGRAPPCSGTTIHTNSLHKNMRRSIAEADACPAVERSCAGV